MGYWENICGMYERQRDKRIKIYGQTLEENTKLSPIERLEYLQEELIDGLMYIEHIKSMLKKGNVKGLFSWSDTKEEKDAEQ